jgi:WD40 repeat protein
MEFTDILQSGTLSCLSLDSALVAILDGSRLTVLDTSTLLVVSYFSNSDQVNRIEWSADGRYVLCAMYKRGAVQVWDVDNPKWVCKITEAPAGIAYNRWSPDGRSILNSNEFNVRITVWSLLLPHRRGSRTAPPKVLRLGPRLQL